MYPRMLSDAEFSDEFFNCPEVEDLDWNEAIEGQLLEAAKKFKSRTFSPKTAEWLVNDFLRRV